MNRLIVSSSPHIKSSAATNRIMLDVIIAALPALVMGTVIFGMRALLVPYLLICLSTLVSDLLYHEVESKAFDNPNALLWFYHQNDKCQAQDVHSPQPDDTDLTHLVCV